MAIGGRSEGSHSTSEESKRLDEEDESVKQDGQTPHLVPPKSADGESGSIKGARIQGLSAEDNRVLVQQVAEMAATAAAVAGRTAPVSWAPAPAASGQGRTVRRRLPVGRAVRCGAGCQWAGPYGAAPGSARPWPIQA